ncbi:MAG: HEPN domain-containing protein [Muribaculaceae bacterium]|nr:HEPN domain-containing protein [Muribaculaceae bacterium]
MKERIDAESRDEYVYYRIQRALETLEEADCLADNGHFSGAVNRLYYACYYIVTALLIYHDIDASSHTGVKSMFALKFIKTGIMDIEFGKFFNEIFQLRHSNDYDDFTFCDEATYKNYRPRAEALITIIKSDIFPDFHT